MLKRLLDEDAITSSTSVTTFHGSSTSDGGKSSKAKLVNKTDSFGFSLVHYAVYNNERDAVELLLKRGSLVDSMAFYLAAMQGHFRILKMFLDEGLAGFGKKEADGNNGIVGINAPLSDGELSMLNAGLLGAVIHNRPVCVAYLLNFGADPFTTLLPFSPEPSSLRNCFHWV